MLASRCGAMAVLRTARTRRLCRRQGHRRAIRDVTGPRRPDYSQRP
jgi:hypothetical protein